MAHPWRAPDDHLRNRVTKEAAMHTLSIEHAITDFPTWKRAFDRFADARAHAGVEGHRIRRPVDNEHYLLIELDFPSLEQAEDFRQFLYNIVWANPDASPGLDGAPQTTILELIAS
jgi:hypothetical protein